MKNNAEWDAFMQTGKVMDYLKYTAAVRDAATGNVVKEERGHRERTGDGDGAVRSDHR